MIESRQRRHRIDLHAAHTLRRQHLFCGIGLDDLWHDDARELREGTSKHRGAPRFDPIVQFVRERALELLNDADDVHARTDTGVRRHEYREFAKKLDVLGEGGADMWALHLDDDRSPAAKPRAVHLPEARRTERLRIEEIEQLAQPSAELRLDRRFDVAERNRPHVVLERFQLADIGRRQQIGSRGQHLPKLDVRGAQLDEPPLEAHRVRLAIGGFIGRQLVIVAGAESEQSLLPGDIAEAIAREQPDDRREARQVLCR